MLHNFHPNAANHKRRQQLLDFPDLAPLVINPAPSLSKVLEGPFAITAATLVATQFTGHDAYQLATSIQADNGAYKKLQFLEETHAAAFKALNEYHRAVTREPLLRPSWTKIMGKKSLWKKIGLTVTFLGMVAGLTIGTMQGIKYWKTLPTKITSNH